MLSSLFRLSLGNACGAWAYSIVQGITSAQSGRHDEDLDDISVCHPPLSLMLA